MPKSKASSVVQIGTQKLFDATAMGDLIGFTGQYVNRLAAAGKIPWHGVRNGAKVYRRYDLQEVKHDVGVVDPAAPKKQKVLSRTGRDKEVPANVAPSP